MDLLEKKLEAIKLYDVYQDLLTEKQRQYVEAYYYDDLSITEISEDFDVSRNAVHDQVKRAVQKLYELESALQIIAKAKKRNVIIEKMKNEQNINTLQELVGELEKVE